jgi:hypothetical protein
MGRHKFISVGSIRSQKPGDSIWNGKGDPEPWPLGIASYNRIRRQPDRTAAFRVLGRGERKVRTPQSDVPDNVRDARFKPGGRKVPQKKYRLGRKAGVRVKRCGKSAPPQQQCRGQGKPHMEQDQIGRKFAAKAADTCRLGASNLRVGR